MITGVTHGPTGLPDERPLVDERAWSSDHFEDDTNVRDKLEALSQLSCAQYYDRFTTVATRRGATVRLLANGCPIATFGDRGLGRFGLMSGLHGDERSGPVALLHWLETVPEADLSRVAGEIWIAPLVNDRGWDDETREWGAVNLNRAFRPEFAPPFLSEIMADLAASPPTLFLDLHEDSTREDAYVFRYTADPHDLAARIEALVGASDEPWEPTSLKRWVGASEVFVRSLGCDRCVTLEVPPTWPLARRVRWYQRVIEYCTPSLPLGT